MASEGDVSSSNTVFAPTIYLQEPLLLLNVLRDLDIVHSVVQAKLLESDIDLVPVRRPRGVT